MLNEVHGVMAPGSSGIQCVRVVDQETYVTIYHTGNDPVRLTAEDCRFLAKQLNAAATRLEKRTKA